MELTANIEGHTYSDLVQALEELTEKVRQEYRSGMDSNDTGNFSFEITGSPVEQYAIKRNGNLLEDRYDLYDEAEEDAEAGDQIIGLDDADIEVAMIPC